MKYQNTAFPLNHIDQLYQPHEMNDDFDYFTFGKNFLKKIYLII